MRRGRVLVSQTDGFPAVADSDAETRNMRTVTANDRKTLLRGWYFFETVSRILR